MDLGKMTKKRLKFLLPVVILVLAFIVFFMLVGSKQPVEQKPLENLALQNELYSYKHHGFWMPMDTLRDKNNLNNMWLKNDAPWKIWK